MTTTVLALVDDLMFGSRIAEAARARGGASQRVRTIDELRAALGPEVRLVIVDCDRPPVALEEVVAAAAGVPVVGFFSHVEPQRGRDARAVGLTRVLPRSAFVKELPELLA